MKKKDLQEYENKYGHVPKNLYDRILYIIDFLKMKEKDIAEFNKAIKKLISKQWHEINFVFYIVPKATPRARYSGRTFTFYVNDAASNSDFFKKFMEEFMPGFSLITTPTIFDMDIFMPTPNQMNKIEKVLAELKLIHAISKPDWDNVGKTYSDMVQKHLLLDDAIICNGRVAKYYSAKPRVEIKIKYLESYDCKYNKKKVEGWKFYKDSSEKIIERKSII